MAVPLNETEVAAAPALGGTTPWHSAQLPVKPLWLKPELANVPVPLNGLAPTWQAEQSSVPMSICPVTGPLSAGLMLAMAYCVAAAALWHWAQLPLVDGAYWWIAGNAGIAE